VESMVAVVEPVVPMIPVVSVESVVAPMPEMAMTVPSATVGQAEPLVGRLGESRMACLGRDDACLGE
jgi:hypothetical protein